MASALANAHADHAGVAERVRIVALAAHAGTDPQDAPDPRPDPVTRVVAAALRRAHRPEEAPLAAGPALQLDDLAPRRDEAAEQLPAERDGPARAHVPRPAQAHGGAHLEAQRHATREEALARPLEAGAQGARRAGRDPEAEAPVRPPDGPAHDLAGAHLEDVHERPGHGLSIGTERPPGDRR